jgi:hypothetical protein
MVAFESLIERDYLYFLDYDADVTWFEEQPLTIEYPYEGDLLHYTPDFHAVAGGRHILVECKPLVFVTRDENQRKFKAARSWCDDQGWVFRIVTDDELRTGSQLENVKLLTRYARYTVEPQVKGRIYAQLHKDPAALSIDAVAKGDIGADYVTATAAVLCMAFHHEIYISLEDGPISGGTLIHLPSMQAREGSV